MGRFWLVIGIALLIWTITAVGRRAKAKEKTVASDQGRTPRRRPSSADIDRFLEEVKRRQTEQRRRQAEPLEVEPVLVLGPSPLPKPPPVRRPPRRAYVEPVLVAEVIPVAVPVAASRRIADKATIPAPEIELPMVAEHVVELHRLLRSTQGLRTALLVNEIFGPPKCKRGRR